ncbi:MAG: Sialic acid-induced transrane protein YjhT(NanM), possible mutarotase [Phycisphaerales bacterium]|nr:Sialic acid-induced transrane protein YjhT(NanM), possible mutarotase [Phycisphaerales bacterium]
MTETTLILLTFLAVSPAIAVADWSRLPPLTDKNGFAGPFAGVSGGALLVAGGANFPDKKPWEGGTKVWYDRVFLLDRPDGSWKIAGRLPRPIGYGVSVSHRDGVVCVGGSDADRHYADAFRFKVEAGKLITVPLPALPKPLANACGALVGDALYVAGGQEKPDASEASKSVFVIDLAVAEPRWREIEACPGGGRILAVAATFDGAFWVAGGAALVVGKDAKVERRYLKDAYRYDPGRGWRRVADLPHPVVAAPSPAPFDAAGFYLLGGDDGSQVGSPPERHRGFSRTALRYDAKTDKWVEVGAMPCGPVTTSVTRWNDRWVIPSGEIRPGVRSPDVWSWTPGKQE